MFSNMTHAQWQAAVAPKVNGTMNLDAVLGASLDFFILLSSGSGTFGPQGQANYSSGNTFQDAFARHRTSLGLPTRTIDVGIVEGEGYTAENPAAAAFISRQGLRGSLKLAELLALLNHAIVHPCAESQAASQNITGIVASGPFASSDEGPVQRTDLRFSHIRASSSLHGTAKAAPGAFDVRSVLQAATTSRSVVDATCTAIVGKLSRLLAIPVEELNTEHSVASYGTDSLVAVELRNWISVQLEAHVQTHELLSPISIENLAGLIAQRSKLVAPDVFYKEKSNEKRVIGATSGGKP
jgi:KR domain/Phosphopantetheine attachment site